MNRLTLFGVAACFLLGAALRAAEPPKNVVSMDKAQATALKKYPGTIKSSELEQEGGKWIYSFDIKGKDAKLREVWIDAKNGKILKQTVESAGEEAKEQESEHGNNS